MLPFPVFPILSFAPVIPVMPDMTTFPSKSANDTVGVSDKSDFSENSEVHHYALKCGLLVLTLYIL